MVGRFCTYTSDECEESVHEFVLCFCQSLSALLLVFKISMSLFRYFEWRNILPDPKGSLSSELCTATIARVNKEVEKVIGSTKEKKRGPYIE